MPKPGTLSLSLDWLRFQVGLLWNGHVCRISILNFQICSNESLQKDPFPGIVWTLHPAWQRIPDMLRTHGEEAPLPWLQLRQVVRGPCLILTGILQFEAVANQKGTNETLSDRLSHTRIINILQGKSREAWKRERERIRFIQHRSTLTHLYQDTNSPQSFTPLPSPHSAPRATPRSAATAGAPRCVPASSAAKTAARQAASSGAPHLQVKVAIWQLGKPQQNATNINKSENKTQCERRPDWLFLNVSSTLKIVQIQQIQIVLWRFWARKATWSDLSGAKQRLWPKSFPSGRLCMLHLEQCLANRRQALQTQYDSGWNWSGRMQEMRWKLANTAGQNLRFEILEGEQKLDYMDYISF